MSAYKDKNQKPIFYYKFLLNEDFKSSKPLLIPPKSKPIAGKQHRNSFSKF